MLRINLLININLYLLLINVYFLYILTFKENKSLISNWFIGLNTKSIWHIYYVINIFKLLIYRYVLISEEYIIIIITHIG